MDPQTTAASGGNYVFQNVYRGLFRYNSQKGLVKEGASQCRRKAMSLVCELNPEHRWSNGERIKAADYVAAFRRLVAPTTKSPQVEMVLTLKNARAIWKGKMPPEKLGVEAVNENTLRFDFAEPDPEFEYKLINPALAPWPPTGILEREKSPEMLFSGPYKISEWKPGHYVHLVPNHGYKLPAAEARPELEAVFIDSDSTALRLYEAGKLAFLRRLPSGEIPRFRNSPEFLQVPLARVEYIGFGPDLTSRKSLREALSHALDFAGFQKLFDTRSPPGCPAIPVKFLDRVECISFDAKKARASLAKKRIPKLQFYYSSMGGDDMNRGAEWLQAQWKKNLNVSVELVSEEQLVFLNRLRTRPPPIFRKAIGLNRPTCLAALENFSQDNPENYLHFSDKKFEHLLQVLRVQKSAAAKKKACRKASEYLTSTARLIPMGEPYFTMLMKQKFQGWDINELNQLDLTDLVVRD